MFVVCEASQFRSTVYIIAKVAYFVNDVLMYNKLNRGRKIAYVVKIELTSTDICVIFSLWIQLFFVKPVSPKAKPKAT